MLNLLRSGYITIKVKYKAIKNPQLKDDLSVVNNASEMPFL